MPLQTSGAISIGDIGAEFDGTAPYSISSFYRGGAHVPDAIVNNNIPLSGTVSLSQFYGGSNAMTLIVSATQTNMNLRTWATNNGWNGNAALTVLITSDVVISSNAQGTPALTIDGSFPNGVTLINNGVIVGKGGMGSYYSTGPGTGLVQAVAGGVGIAVSAAVSITNNGTIGGGGGGGGMATPSGSPYGVLGGNGGVGFGADGWNWHHGNYGVYWQYAGGASTNGTSSATSVSTAGGNIWKSSYPYMNSTYSRRPVTGQGGPMGGSGGVAERSFSEGSGAINTFASSPAGGGAAITGDSFITWNRTGTRNGVIT